MALFLLDGTSFSSGSLTGLSPAAIIEGDDLWNTFTGNNQGTKADTYPSNSETYQFVRNDHWTNRYLDANNAGGWPGHQNNNRLVNFVNSMKAANSGKKISLRNRPVFRPVDFEDADRQEDIENWNDFLERVIDVQSFLSPELVIESGMSLADWEYYATKTVEYAAKWNKEVVVILSWNFEGTNTYVGDTIWQGMLAFCNTNVNIDGAVIVGGSGTFDPNAAFYNVLEQYK